MVTTLGSVFALVAFHASVLAGPIADAKYDMVPFEAGSFIMGDERWAKATGSTTAQAMASAQGQQYISPASWRGPRTVALTQPFMIGRTEVTRALWISVMGKPRPNLGLKVPLIICRFG